jgi:hypothetical protein
MLNSRPITTMKIFDAEEIALSGNALSVAIDLREIANNGYFAIHYITTGTGTTKFEYLFAPVKAGTYIEPAGATDIGATLAAGSGIKSFSPELGPFMKIKATEDGGANAIVVTAWIHIQ